MCAYYCSRQAGHRFGEHLEKMVPPIVKFCREEDDELREYCLQAFESFVRRCPKEISPFVSEVYCDYPPQPCQQILVGGVYRNHPVHLLTLSRP